MSGTSSYQPFGLRITFPGRNVTRLGPDETRRVTRPVTAGRDTAVRSEQRYERGNSRPPLDIKLGGDVAVQSRKHLGSIETGKRRSTLPVAGIIAVQAVTTRGDEAPAPPRPNFHRLGGPAHARATQARLLRRALRTARYDRSSGDLDYKPWQSYLAPTTPSDTYDPPGWSRPRLDDFLTNQPPVYCVRVGCCRLR